MKKAILAVTRKWFTKECCIGELYLDGKFFCYTLEDVVRPAGSKKVASETAIPAGHYPVTVENSPTFKKLLPRLHQVPGFAGVLLHSGNSAADTRGCILLGYSKLPTNLKIYNNVPGQALTDLMAVLLLCDEIEITVQ